MEYTAENKNYKLVIEHDEFGEKPNLWFDSRMFCIHGRYDIGDEHDHSRDYGKPMDSFKKYIYKVLEGRVILPIYLLDHSGLRVSTEYFSCSWDSMQIGYIFVTRDQILKEYGVTRLTPTIRREISNRLKEQVKTYDTYIRGDVYCLSLYEMVYNKDTNRVEEINIGSCGGIYKDGTTEQFKDTIMEECSEIEPLVLKELLKGMK